jgi:hypothetical protein
LVRAVQNHQPGASLVSRHHAKKKPAPYLLLMQKNAGWVEEISKLSSL